MGTESELLAAVLAHPDEDTPRLAYADWLDEHAADLPGRDPREVRDRAAFIRFQIAQENDPPEPASWDESQERRRLGELQYKYPTWRPPPPTPKVEFSECHRGFAERLVCDAAEFVARAPEVFAVAPVRRLTVRGMPATTGLAALGASPHIGRIRHLDFAGGYEAADLVALCRSPHLHDMIELYAGPLDCSDETVVALAACGGLDGLRALRLWNGFGLAGVKALVDSPHFDRLRTLDLCSQAVGDDGARAVAGGRFLSSLKELSLHGCKIGEAGVAALTAAPELGPLTGLKLGDNPIMAAGAAVLAQCERLRSVRTLGMGGCRLGDAGAARLGGTDVFAGVRSLRLSHNGLGPDGIRALFAGGAFRQLWKLELDSNDALGDDGAAAVADAPLDELRSLDLPWCEIGNAGAIALANSPRLRHLRELHLHHNQIGNAGARALLNSPHLTRLEKLDLVKCRLDYGTERAVAARFGDPE